MWLLLLTLIIGWWLTVDSAVSIAFRLNELNDSEITTREKIEFSARVIRGLIGLVLVVVAFLLVSFGGNA